MGSWTVTSPAYGEDAGYGHVVKAERRELAGLLAIAVVFAVACVFLGRWQYHRFQEKYAADHLVGRNYRSAPVSLDRLVDGSPAQLAAKDVWRPVRVSGSYDLSAQVLVRNRPLDGAYGYEVLVPLVPASGGPALLVDRGWLPNGQSSDAPDSVPAAPSGSVTVTAHLLPGEPGRNATDPKGIRLGVQEMTRCGMGEAEMDEVARLVAEAADGKAVREDVGRFRARFRDVRYGYREADLRP